MIAAAPRSDLPAPPGWLAGPVEWLSTTGFALRDAAPLPGDVSARRYARLTSVTGATAILAVYPPGLRAACRRFRESGALLTQAGVRVPRLLAADDDRGLMLLEDLGEGTVYDRFQSWSQTLPYLRYAAEQITRFQTISAQEVARLNPPLDAAALEAELAPTWSAFLLPAGLVDDALAAPLRQALSRLCATLAAGPPVACHRDYMARNLMPGAGAEVAVLDHQDLRLGPACYDLASLLNDSLFPPPEVERQLLGELPARAAGLASYRRAAVQRTLKAVGTFARTGHHLRLIPPTFERALGHLRALPETATPGRRLTRAWQSAERPAFC